MENVLSLSLGSWPTYPFTGNFKTSPTSLRVIKKSKVQIEQILPLSFPQYIREKNLMNTSRTQVEQMYQQELKRRNRKVQILQEIWLKLKSKRSKSSKQYLSTKSSCLLFSSKINTTKRNSSRSLHGSHKNSKSKSPLFFHAKSPTKGSTYFDYYNTHQNKEDKKKSYEQESTQSRRQKTLSASRSNDEYFNNHWAKKATQKNTKVKVTAREQFTKSIEIIVKQLEDLELKHKKELQQYDDLTERERRRLFKIHEIEKERMRKKIQSTRLNFSLHKKIVKGLN